MYENKCVIGIDIGGTITKSAILNRSAEILFRKEIKTLPRRSAERIIKDVDLLIGECEKKADVSGIDVIGIGIILAGYPDENGIISFIPNIPSLTSFPIRKYLSKHRKTPIIFENDGNAAAYGEYIFGQRKRIKNIIVLSLGTGIGSGVIINGKILKGKAGISGELGHITLNHKGPECVCGKNGCLESYFSAYAIKRITEEYLNRNTKAKTTLRNYDIKDITPSDVAIEAERGDKISKHIFDYSGKWLGIGISIMINSFNPDKLIIAGGLSKSSNLYIKQVKIQAEKNIHSQFINNTIIEKSKFADKLGIISAASLFFNP